MGAFHLRGRLAALACLVFVKNNQHWTSEPKWLALLNLQPRGEFARLRQQSAKRPNRTRPMRSLVGRSQPCRRTRQAGCENGIRTYDQWMSVRLTDFWKYDTCVVRLPSKFLRLFLALVQTSLGFQKSWNSPGLTSSASLASLWVCND